MSFFEWVASTSIYGLPLDIPAHLLVGLVIFLIARKSGSTAHTALAVVFAMALLKELTFDLRIWWTWGFYLEPIKDIIVSLLLPGVWMLRIWVQRERTLLSTE
ncbi:hypothetical protein COB52_04720 [Candidatus Kaiserbacteria bacterium]|nr:MAG: hypothetical protein COB52_04720 [Candidatus Kaiserbacteria bacterium]